MNRVKIYILVIGIGMLTWQCANRLGLEGGTRDMQPPQMDWENSDKNFQKNFDQDEFQLSFNEFVKIDKPNEQIVVSPPLRYGLTPVSRGKKVILRFHPDEELLDSTTYSIQFGDAIQDITESNPIKNLRYVFSTGNIIDSMQIRVRVQDLQTSHSVSNALVMLYETMSDTMIRKGRPTFFSKTDSSGLAIVENCRPGEYRVFALVDENRNYQFDLPTEKVGYLDTLVSSSLDVGAVYNINIYAEIDPPIQVDAVKIDTQLTALTIAGEKEYLTWRMIDQSPIQSFWDGDTLFIRSDSQGPLLLESDYLEPDTVILTGLKTSKRKNGRFNTLNLESQDSKVVRGELLMRTKWKNPIRAYDASNFVLFDNLGDPASDVEIKVTLDSISPQKMTLQWKHQELRDSLLILPEALASWGGQNDTIMVLMRPQRAESLSNLLVKVEALDESKQYVIQLYSSTEELINSALIRESESFKLDSPGFVS